MTGATWLVGLAPVVRLREWMAASFSVEPEQFVSAVQELSDSLSGVLAQFFGGLLSRAPGMLTSVMMLLLGLLFLLVDGRRLQLFARTHSPFGLKDTDFLIKQLKGYSRSVVLASVVASALQGLTFTAGGVLAGLPQPFLVGFLVFVGAFIPVVGSVSVTVASCLFMFATGPLPAGLFLSFVAVLVLLIDNFARPWVLRGASNMHPLLAFIGVLGGIQTFGFAGVFLGPILVGLSAAWLGRITGPQEH